MEPAAPQPNLLEEWDEHVRLSALPKGLESLPRKQSILAPALQDFEDALGRCPGLRQ